MPPSLIHRYAELVCQGRLQSDPAQESAIRRLDSLAQRLANYRLALKSSPLNWLLGPKRNGDLLRGLFVWGAVGRGKTMLMDLFYEAAPVDRKRRVHFNAFMADVHGRLHDVRQRIRIGEVKGDDPVLAVADALADQAWLLCFDEFTVTDITDAMLLGRLFKALFERGVVVVATSNVDPENLYKDGLNRALFLPFIALLRQRMDVLRLEARTDFRLEKLNVSVVYHTPADAAARAALDRSFFRLTGQARGARMTIDVLGHALAVPQAAAGVARFSFSELCEQPLGPADFLAIARQFHTLLLDDIPVINAGKRNEARRFITLIDALYDQHVKLVGSAAAEPPRLYAATEGREAFDFARTASRLIEMRSQDYLALPHGRVDSKATEDSTGIVET